MRPRALLFAAVFSLTFTGAVQAAWYNGSWAKRTQLTLNGALVPAAQTDFPVLVAWTADAALAAAAQANGNDILFTARRRHDQAGPRDRVLHVGHRRPRRLGARPGARFRLEHDDLHVLRQPRRGEPAEQDRRLGRELRGRLAPRGGPCQRRRRPLRLDQQQLHRHAAGLQRRHPRNDQRGRNRRPSGQLQHRSLRRPLPRGRQLREPRRGRGQHRTATERRLHRRGLGQPGEPRLRPAPDLQVERGQLRLPAAGRTRPGGRPSSGETTAAVDCPPRAPRHSSPTPGTTW